MVESYGTWLLFQRLDDASKDSDIPKNVPFAFAINNRNTHTHIHTYTHTYTHTFSENAIEEDSDASDEDSE